MYREKHHIVFKSQGGLDFELNYKKLSMEDHRGNFGPHKNRTMDLALKEGMQRELEDLLVNEFYELEELIDILDLKKKQAYKAFKKITYHPDRGMKTIDIIFRLMGNRFYL